MLFAGRQGLAANIEVMQNQKPKNTYNKCNRKMLRQRNSGAKQKQKHRNTASKRRRLQMNQNTQNPKLLLQIPFAKSESAPHAKISIFESIIFLIIAESP